MATLVVHSMNSFCMYLHKYKYKYKGRWWCSMVGKCVHQGHSSCKLPLLQLQAVTLPSWNTFRRNINPKNRTHFIWFICLVFCPHSYAIHNNINQFGLHQIVAAVSEQYCNMIRSLSTLVSFLYFPTSFCFRHSSFHGHCVLHHLATRSCSSFSLSCRSRHCWPCCGLWHFS